MDFTSMNMIVIRNKVTGREFAYPESRYSELPTVSIENGEPGHTGFGRGELVRMVEYGNAKVVGRATLAIAVTYNEDQAA